MKNLSKADWKDILVDVLSLREFAKQYWGTEVKIPDDFGMDVKEWEYQLSRLMTHKDPVKLIKSYAKNTR